MPAFGAGFSSAFDADSLSPPAAGTGKVRSPAFRAHGFIGPGGFEFIAATGADHDLTAVNIESASEVGSTALGQAHALTAINLESASEVSAPSLGQAHALTAINLESVSEVSAPSLSEAGPATIQDIYNLVAEIHAILGLTSGSPMTVTPTSRVSGDISQTISGDGTTSTTVTRDP